jgi:hypothetical protein
LAKRLGRVLINGRAVSGFGGKANIAVTNRSFGLLPFRKSSLDLGILHDGPTRLISTMFEFDAIRLWLLKH